jgi:uncharacterized protein (DUF433 family)
VNDWQELIVSDPAILGGKPVLRGTRLAIDFLLELLAAGWTIEQLRENYPSLDEPRLRAVFAYAAHAVTRDASPPAQRAG